ncbi:MAG: SRPBCC family protein [Pseudonocardiaceae bacterium]
MTTPDVPLRMELTFELPGTPEQVWAAIATANGISSWMMPTDLEEREGGAICFHMGDMDSSGTVTGWDPPRRFAYEEPDWAALAGHEGAPVTPLVSEFLVDARSGGRCVLRVVTSGFGTGAEWEREFFADMETYWAPSFDHLRLYLAHFPGQQATLLSVATEVPGSADAVLSAIRQGLGAEEVGHKVDTRGITGQVERIGQVELLESLDTAPAHR